MSIFLALSETSREKQNRARGGLSHSHNCAAVMDFQNVCSCVEIITLISPLKSSYSSRVLKHIKHRNVTVSTTSETVDRVVDWCVNKIII